MLRSTLGFVALVALVGCDVPPEPEIVDGFQVTRLPNCGVERVGELSIYRELPATNEGSGFVGFATEEQNAAGRNYQRFSLVNCATRALVRVEGELDPVGTRPDGGRDTVFQTVQRLRNRDRLAPTFLIEQSREDGWDAREAVLPEVGSEAATRADCGCRRFYAETVSRAGDTEVVAIPQFIVEQ